MYVEILEQNHVPGRKTGDATRESWKQLRYALRAMLVLISHKSQDHGGWPFGLVPFFTLPYIRLLTRPTRTPEPLLTPRVGSRRPSWSFGGRTP